MLHLLICIIMSTQSHKTVSWVKLQVEKKSKSLISLQVKKILFLRHLGSHHPAFKMLRKCSCPTLAVLLIAVIKLCFHFRIMKQRLINSYPLSHILYKMQYTLLLMSPSISQMKQARLRLWIF